MVMHVLNAAVGPLQKLLKRRFSLNERSSPQIVSVDIQQIERAGNRFMLEAAAMQAIKVRAAALVLTDDFAVKYRVTLQTRGLLHDERVALGPVGGIHGVEPHAS